MSDLDDLRTLIRTGIDQHAAYALDDDELADLVEGIAEQILAAGWPRTPPTNPTTTAPSSSPVAVTDDR